MLKRTIGAGLTLAAVALTAGCVCHHHQVCSAPPTVSRAPCCPPAGGVAPAGAMPVQTYSSPVVYPSYPPAAASSH